MQSLSDVSLLSKGTFCSRDGKKENKKMFLVKDLVIDF